MIPDEHMETVENLHRVIRDMKETLTRYRKAHDFHLQTSRVRGARLRAHHADYREVCAVCAPGERHD